MRRNQAALFVQLVWATWDRCPMVRPEIERRLHRSIEAEAQRSGCTVAALNGTEDHIHLLVELPTTVSVAMLVKQVKGASSHLMTHEVSTDGQFKWQGSYGAFSVSRWDVPRTVEYIKRQKERHRSGEVLPEWETWDHEQTPLPTWTRSTPLAARTSQSA